MDRSVCPPPYVREVVREGLRLMERRNQEDQARLDWLRGAVTHGLDEIDRGEGIEFSLLTELDRLIDRIDEDAPSEPPKGRRG